ncbi:PDDEXK nuclease domain-containing protein [Capnocytophaga catalasegens]|uniref:YhcG PDDEXK nuclease domain-containing protein n=1 Tax=Capnocytophaga catalasegens TaxID=1004260 RepID=A0AAV5AV86_9FLAO|nr:PDDEXK nuclease domain-containing protein [Capnocytophaga catalasegens]GIZ14683.1 hypothetical protein RCZ03_06840 [Capnocytophaga catalasegens]GJM51207.1 hypothetical protein RCZ15_21800 [Capnocytophaga catalasegens]GJM52282.1 hypothetical protein RCZ16_06000 [Capnocytophaga catalasegens]
MNIEIFKKYLKQRGFAESSVKNRISNCLKIESAYNEDLDLMYSKDGFQQLLRDLEYTTEDSRNKRKPNHKIPIEGDIRNGSATYKSALNLYKEFKESNFVVEDEEFAFFKYEKDLEDAICKDIKNLFPDYGFVKNQYRLSNEEGNNIIDILLQNKVDKHFLIVEIKANELDEKAFAQISRYITIFKQNNPNTEVKGCLIGSDFSDLFESIVKSSKYSIEVKKYQMKINLL